MAVGPRTLVLVCRGPECGERRGSAAVHQALAVELRAKGLLGRDVKLDWQSCFGQCRRGVNVMVRECKPGEDLFFVSFKPGGARSALYHGVLPEDAPRIVAEHVVGGRVIDELKRRNAEPDPAATEPKKEAK